MNRRSLLKTIGACLGFGLWNKTGEGVEIEKYEFRDMSMVKKEDMCRCGEELEPTEVCFYNNVCDPLPLPEGDFEKGIHNATFVRSVDGGVAWVRLMTGQYRLVENAFTGRGEESAGMRVVLQSDEDHGLFICGWLD